LFPFLNDQCQAMKKRHIPKSKSSYFRHFKKRRNRVLRMLKWPFRNAFPKAVRRIPTPPLSGLYLRSSSRQNHSKALSRYMSSLTLMGQRARCHLPIRIPRGTHSPREHSGVKCLAQGHINMDEWSLYPDYAPPLFGWRFLLISWLIVRRRDTDTPTCEEIKSLLISPFERASDGKDLICKNTPHWFTAGILYLFKRYFICSWASQEDPPFPSYRLHTTRRPKC